MIEILLFMISIAVVVTTICIKFLYKPFPEEPKLEDLPEETLAQVVYKMDKYYIEFAHAESTEREAFGKEYQRLFLKSKEIRDQINLKL